MSHPNELVDFRMQSRSAVSNVAHRVGEALEQTIDTVEDAGEKRWELGPHTPRDSSTLPKTLRAKWNGTLVERYREHCEPSADSG